jgi:hypothetical protein
MVIKKDYVIMLQVKELKITDIDVQFVNKKKQYKA